MARRATPQSAEAVLRERAREPSEAALRERLGPAHAAWRTLLASLPGVEQEWKLYSAKAGWVLKLKEGDRTLLYAHPQDGEFRVIVVLGERAVQAALAARLSLRLREAIAAARPYVEGRSVPVVVRGPADLSDVESLLPFKREVPSAGVSRPSAPVARPKRLAPRAGRSKR